MSNLVPNFYEFHPWDWFNEVPISKATIATYVTIGTFTTNSVNVNESFLEWQTPMALFGNTENFCVYWSKISVIM